MLDRETRFPVIVGVQASPNAAAWKRLETGGSIVEIGLSDEYELKGRVTDAAGKSIGGASIVASFDAYNSYYASESADVFISAQLFDDRAETDSDGAFLLGRLGGSLLKVEAAHPRFGRVVVEGLSIPREDPLQLVLGAGTARCRGRVRLTTTGQPVASVRVVGYGFEYGVEKARSPAAYSEKDGSFALDGLAAGWSDNRVTFEKPGLGMTVRDIDVVRDGDLIELDVAMSPTLDFLGFVTDPLGNPLSRAQLMAMDPAYSMVLDIAQTDASGKFVIHTIAGDEPFVLKVTNKDFSPLFRVIRRGWPEPHTYVLSPEQPLLGRLVTDYYPLEKPRVRAIAEGARYGRVITKWAEVDPATGTFEFAGLAAGTYVLDAFAEGFARSRIDGIALDVIRPREAVEIVMKKGSSLRGRVVQRGSGKPIGGATIYLGDPSPGEDPTYNHFDEAFTSNADGTFSIEGVSSDSKSGVVVSASGYGTRHFLLNIGAAEGVANRVFELDLGASVKITATRPDGSKSREFVGSVNPPDGYFSSQYVIGGELVLDGLQAGHVAARVDLWDPSPPEYRGLSLEESLDLAPGEHRDVNISFHLGATIRGHVNGPERLLEPGSIAVHISPPENDPAYRSYGSLRLTGSDYVAYGVRPGPVKVLVYPAIPGSFVTAEKRLTVEEGKEYTVDIEIGDAVQTGAVLDANGAAVVEAWVSMRRTKEALKNAGNGEETDSWHSDLSKSDGAYRIEGLGPGELELRVRARGYGRARGRFLPIVRSDGSFEPHEIRLAREGVVKVKVQDRGGEDVAGARVELAPADVPDDPYVPEAQEGVRRGEARFLGVGVGVNVLRVSAEGFVPYESETSVAAGDVFEATVVLRRPAALEFILRDGNGAPLEGAAPSLVDVTTGYSLLDLARHGLISAATLDAKSDKTGALRYEGLPEGEYRIVFGGIEAKGTAGPGGSEKPITLMLGK